MVADGAGRCNIYRIMIFIKIARSFGYAMKGIAALVRSQRNARIHLAATVVVVTAGFSVGVSRGEWIFLCLAIGFVWVAEAFNTAVERLVDMVSPERHPQAGMVKDLSAAGVLISAATALAVGLIIFLPYVF